MLWFNFILDLNYVFLCFKLIICLFSGYGYVITIPTEQTNIKLNHENISVSSVRKFYCFFLILSSVCSVLS